MALNASKRRGFTLIELLVVMGIMATMIAIAIPAIKGMTRSSGMQSATMQMRSVLTFARQWAITRRDTTYVLFATNAADGDLRYRAYNVYSVREANWIRDWMTLPAGLRFDPYPDTTNNVLGNWATKNNECAVSNGTSGVMRGFRFKADGSSSGLNDIWTRPTVYISDAIFFDDGTVTNLPGGTTSGLQVSSMAGQMRTFSL